jgi:hypothetical protein
MIREGFFTDEKLAFQNVKIQTYKVNAIPLRGMRDQGARIV